MNTAIAVSLALLVLIVGSCLAINAYLLLSKQISDPHGVMALAKQGHLLARIYVGLFVLSVAVFLLLLVLVTLRT
jgi:hypothetical protein